MQSVAGKFPTIGNREIKPWIWELAAQEQRKNLETGNAGKPW
jgi:hypothetical protein